MKARHNPSLVAYLRQLATGPLLARTVHDSILQGHTSLGGNAMVLWQQVTRDMGQESARVAVEAWISKPYSLR